MRPSGPGLLLVGRFLISVSISVLVCVWIVWMALGAAFKCQVLWTNGRAGLRIVEAGRGRVDRTRGEYLRSSGFSNVMQYFI